MEESRATIDPGHCRHGSIERIGIQKAPFFKGQGAIRLYLVTCRLCGTTLTTRTLRDLGRSQTRRRAG